VPGAGSGAVRHSAHQQAQEPAAEMVSHAQKDPENSSNPENFSDEVHVGSTAHRAQVEHMNDRHYSDGGTVDTVSHDAEDSHPHAPPVRETTEKEAVMAERLCQASATASASVLQDVEAPVSAHYQRQRSTDGKLVQAAAGQLQAENVSDTPALPVGHAQSINPPRAQVASGLPAELPTTRSESSATGNWPEQMAQAGIALTRTRQHGSAGSTSEVTPDTGRTDDDDDELDQAAPIDHSFLPPFANAENKAINATVVVRDPILP
jgi:hypothetical protein